MFSVDQISDSALFYFDGSEGSNFSEIGNATNGTETSSEALPHPDVLLPYSVLLSIAIYLTIVGILSTFGNILFILTVIRWRYLRNNSHMLLLLNMAVSDLAISITGYPYTTVSGYIGKWIFGSTMCQLYAFLCFTFSQVSMNTLVAVSIFRYIAVCHPHLKHLLTSRTSMMALGIVWCHALFWTIAPLVGWSSYTFEPTRISCSFDWNDRTFGGVTYVIGTTLFCYLSHIIVLVWCYRRIFQTVYSLKSITRLRGSRFPRAGRSTPTTTLDTTLSNSKPLPNRRRGVSGLKNHRLLLDAPASNWKFTVGNLQQPEQDDNEDILPDSPPGLPRCQSLIVFSFATENLTEMELHVLGMNIAMVLAFITFWTPYAIISCISAFYDKLSPFWYIFPTIFAKTSCMINPLLYGLTNSFLRKQLLLVLRGFLGLTTAIEDFQVMRQRQQDGLYNKEGIFVGKRTGAITHCPCEGCVSSRRQIKILIEKQKQRIEKTTNSSSDTIKVSSEKQETSAATTALQGHDHEEEPIRSTESDGGEGEFSLENCSVAVLYENYNDSDDDDDDTTNQKGSPQRHPSPLSVSSKEFSVEGAHYSSSNAIILNVNTLSALATDKIDGKSSGELLQTSRGDK